METGVLKREGAGLTSRSPVTAKTLLGLQIMCTRAGLQPRAALSSERTETKGSSPAGRSGESKVSGPKTSSEMRWMALAWQNFRQASSWARVKQRPSGLCGFERISALIAQVAF